MPEDPPQNLPKQYSDWFLEMLVKIANSGDSMGITLQVGGFLVSGTLVGGAEYFEGFAKDFASTFKPEHAETMRQAVAEAAEPYKTARAVDLDLPAEFIHLKNVQFFSHAGSPVSSRGVWWRGRVCEVSGFILGSLSDG
jgi:hypothetical protein